MGNPTKKALGFKMGGGKDANKPKTLGRFKMGGSSAKPGKTSKTVKK